ncbi:hypothetical protein ACGYK1_18240 [Sulfitobacter sp. 1A13191]
MLLLHMQGAFEKEAPEAVAGTGKDEIEWERWPVEMPRDSNVEELSDEEKRLSDGTIDRVLGDIFPEPETKEKPKVMATQDAIADALAGVLGDRNEMPAAGSQPPLSSAKKQRFAEEITACWNIGALSTEASRTAVEVGVQMNADGTPIASSMRLIASQGGSEAAARQVVEAAKRAIIRYGSRGYDLPYEKLASDGTMVITFDPGRTTFAAGITVRQIIGH